MSQHYSRSQKSSKKDKEQAPSKHIKKGFSAFQKTIALIGSILSIIVASITITNALKGSSSQKPTDKSTATVVIKEGNKSNNNKTDTSASTTYSSSAANNSVYNSDTNSNNATYDSSSDSTTYSSSADTTQDNTQTSSQATSDTTAESVTETNQ